MTTSQPRTREELYEQIRQTSREEFIVSDMIRLGFWPAAGEMPHDPADDIRRRGELQRQLDELRKERAENWQQRKAKEIIYLGKGVSGGLNFTECDDARLQQYGLPRFDSAEQIAAAMGITVSELRFLSFSRKTSNVNHYVRFKLPKKTGGKRLISVRCRV
jgi:hypothetical protein